MESKILSYLKLVCLLVILALYSCSEEEAPPAAPPDMTKPTITIVSPTDISKPLRATVTVKAEASDDTGIAKVEVFVDGTSIASAVSSPIEASWDTKTVTDGSHVVKFVAEDAEGNKEEKSIQVEVKNVLFGFLVGPQYLSADESGWIFVTDESGAIIDTQEMINGEKLTFDTPEGFELSDRFAFHRFEYLLEDLGENTFGDSFVVSYTGLPSGSYIMNDGTRAAKSSLGSHSINVNNFPIGPGGPPFFSQIISFDGAYSSTTLSNSVYTVEVDLLKSPATLILSNQESSTLIKGIKIDLAEVGDVTEIDYGDLSEFDFNLVDVGEHIGESFNVSMVPIANDYVNTVFFTGISRYFVSPISDPIKVYIPGLNPVEFITSLSYEDLESVTRRYTVASPSIPAQLKTIDADVSIITESNGMLEVEATGDFQFVSVASYFFDLDENGNSLQFSWAVFADKSSTGNIAKPQFPESLHEEYPNIAAIDHTFNFVSLFKHEGIDDYLDYVDKRYSGDRIYKFSKEQFQTSRSFAPSGGRVGNRTASPYRGTDIPKSERHK